MTEPVEDHHASAILEAERAVLAAMLLGEEACALGAGLLEPRDFHRLTHQRMFAGLCAISARGERADAITLTFELQGMGVTCAEGWPATIAQVTDYAGTAANLEEHARIVREAAAKRRWRKIGQATVDAAMDPQKASAEILAGVRQALEQAGATAEPEGDGRFAACDMGATTFTSLVIPRPRSLLGDGVLVAGGFGILYGSPGMGKSWLSLALGGSLARGLPWYGLETDSAGASVGLIQLELGAFSLQERLRTLGIGGHGRDNDLHLVSRPNLKGAIDLFRQPSDMAGLRRWIEKRGLSVLIIDAFSRAHTANENLAEEMGQVLGALDAIRHETGCAIILIHHEPKSQAGRDPSNHLDALRGSSRLQSDPTLLMRVYQSRGLRCLTFVKVSEGASPQDVFYTIREDGRPEIVQSPESVREGNREKVLAAIRDAGRLISRAEIQAVVGMAQRTVGRHLQGLLDDGSITVFGENRDARYTISTLPPGQPGQDDMWPGSDDKGHNKLGESWE